MTDETLDVVTIDPPMSVDLDDAVDVRDRPGGGYVVDVCLPDLPAFVEPGSPTDARGMEIGFTRYAASYIRKPLWDEGVVGRLSLRPGDARPMIWVRLSLDDELDVVDLAVKRILAKTSARLSYLRADEILSDKRNVLHSKINRMWSLAKRLYARRHARAGALFDPASGLYTTEEGVMAQLAVKERHQSHLIVMELMILANSSLALHCRARSVPILYRNHKPQDHSCGFRAEVLRELASIHADSFKAATERMISLGARIGPAVVGPECEGHWGLDLPAYAWFTSPLRRYVDLVNLRALVDGTVAPDLAGLGARLTTLHQEEKQRRLDQFAEAARRRIAKHVADGDAAELAAYDFHLILKSCAEHGGDAEKLAAELVTRRDAGRLSGKDVEGVFTYGRALFPESVVAELAAWIVADDARTLALLRDMVQRQRIVRIPQHADGSAALAAGFALVAEQFDLPLPADFAARMELETREVPRPRSAPCASAVERASRDAPIPHPNPKGALLEFATTRRAVASFSEPVRSGPPHDPRFEVAARWTDGFATKTSVGTGSSVKAAEKVAAYRMLVDLGIVPIPAGERP